MSTAFKLCVFVTLVHLSLSAVHQLPTVKECYADTDCGDDYCCAKQIGPHLLSKRQLHTTVDPATVKGSCKLWLRGGDFCGGFNIKNNGGCGCHPSLVCNWYPPVTMAVGKRSIYGISYCETKTNQ